MQGAHERFVRVTITIGYARVTVTIGCTDNRRIATSLYHNEDKYKGKFVDGHSSMLISAVGHHTIMYLLIDTLQLWIFATKHYVH